MGELIRKESELRENNKDQNCQIEGLKSMLEKGSSEKFKNISQSIERMTSLIMNGSAEAISEIRNNPLIQNLVKNTLNSQLDELRSERRDLKSKLDDIST